MDVAGSLERAGLYDPSAADAASRLELIEHLLEGGVTIDEMVAAERSGQLLVTLSADRMMIDLGAQLTPEQIARKVGVVLDRVLRVRLAAGFPGDIDQPVPEWVADDVAGFELALALFGEGATLAFTRVMGSAASKVAEAAIDLFAAEVDSRLNARGALPIEWALANEQAASLVEVATAIITHLLREHLVLAIRRQRADIETHGNVRPTAVGFVDLANSTEWGAALSLPQQAEALALFERAAWEIATTTRGRVVKLIGDEAMFTAADPVDALEIALDLCAAVDAEPTLPPARGAVGFGDVVTRDGDVYGPLVHVIARAVKVAEESAVVVDAAVASRCREAGARIDFADLGPQRLKGIEMPVTLYRAVSLDRPRDRRGADLETPRSP
jgi:adenylate cyclase